ncbi:MAG: hypothetical protein KDB84_04705, partial [Flavobacteriales bacterium]|nr:hypothetical protein [Flavobacteriales bacterium]
MMLRYAFVLGLFPAGTLLAQPCMTSFTATASPQPVNGTYGCGETVTFCFTVTNWNSTNANWFHGIEANFGPGWDMSTLVPGPPPATCGPSAGTWGWYNNVSGQGPGFFFDLNNDGNPANNYGDFCTGAVNWQFCWTISVLSGPACQDGLSLAVNIDTFSDSQTGSWGSNGCGNDPNPSVFPGPVVIAACTANAGIGAPIDLCTTAPPTVLFNSLAGTPDAGGSWTDPAGAPHSGTLDPSVDAPGAYTYTVTSVAPPCSVQSVITVSVVQQPDAGIDGAITTCASEPSFPLAGLLGGTPSPGGTWSGPAGASSGTFDPAVDVGGAYTYSFPATAPCAAASATVMVTVNPSPTAGVDGNLTLCSSSPATALFASLGGSPDPGGTWSGPGGTPTSGTYDPATDGPGVYTYTVQGVAPCPNSTATVTVVENTEPDPGLDAATSFCSSDGATPLIGLLGGSPTPGGTWTGPSGNAIGGTLTPATAGSGAYTYTIGATAPCVGGQAVATITIVPAPDAGADGAVAVCDAGAPFSLFDELGGTPDAGGTWANAIGVPSTGTFDPNGDEAGVYTYTVAGVAPCANSTATVTVTVSAQPTAGSDGVAALCESGQTLDLFTALGGSPTPGGSWSAPGGGATTALLDPGTAVSGTYTYTVPGTAPCANDVAIVTVTIATEPDPGTDASTTLCQGSAAVDLFTVLGGSPDPGGVWTGPGGTVVPSLFDPATGAPGTYTYTLQATAPCTAQSATVGVTVG